MSKKYYSPTTNGWYPEEMLDMYRQAKTLPDDLVEVSESEYSKLLNKPIKPNSSGKPIEAKPSKEDRKGSVRAKRDGLVKQVQWRFERYYSEERQGIDTTDDIKQLDQYVQALRDIPEQEGFPDDIVWPEEP